MSSTYEKYAQIYEYIGLYATNYGRNYGSIFMKLSKMLLVISSIVPVIVDGKVVNFTTF